MLMYQLTFKCISVDICRLRSPKHLPWCQSPHPGPARTAWQASAESPRGGSKPRGSHGNDWEVFWWRNGGTNPLIIIYVGLSLFAVASFLGTSRQEGRYNWCRHADCYLKRQIWEFLDWLWTCSLWGISWPEKALLFLSLFGATHIYKTCCTRMNEYLYQTIPDARPKATEGRHKKRTKVKEHCYEP